MAAIHLSFLLSLMNAWLFYASSFCDQLFYLLVPSIRNSFEKSIFHFFVVDLLLEESELFSGEHFFMERVDDSEFVFDIFEAIEQRVHVKLFSAFLSLSRNGVEYLTLA